MPSGKSASPKKSTPQGNAPPTVSSNAADEGGSIVDKMTGIARSVTSGYLKAAERCEEDTLYSTLEDFSRVTSHKRMVVIGGTGSGKSTMLNVIAGYKFVQSKATNYDFKWTTRTGESIDDESKLLFMAKQQVKSTTKHSSFANVRWLGRMELDPLVVVDTPGYDDTSGYDVTSADAQKQLGLQAADLHNKLKALGHVHTLLVIHNDVNSNKINPGTFEILRMVDEKFALSGRPVWEHVVIGYSKCNPHETSWRSGLEKKKVEVQKLLKDHFPRCKTDVPVIPLGGGENSDDKADKEKDGFDELYEIVTKAEPLDTSNLQPFEGTAEQFRKAVEARDSAEARAKAALIYGYVLCKFLMFIFCLTFRQSFSNTFSRTLMFNPEFILDEIALVAAFVYWIGPTDCMNSVKVGLEQHVYPRLPQGWGFSEKAKAE